MNERKMKEEYRLILFKQEMLNKKMEKIDAKVDSWLAKGKKVLDEEHDIEMKRRKLYSKAKKLGYKL